MITDTSPEKDDPKQAAGARQQTSGKWRRLVINLLPPLLPFRYQLLGHLIAALVVSLLLTLALAPAETEPEGRSAPFTTQSDMLTVTVAVYPDAPPEILGVQPLNEGRISVTQPGDYTLSLQNEKDETLHSLSFRASFNIPGLGRLEENRLIFVFPHSVGAEQFVVAGPQGSTSYPLSE